MSNDTDRLVANAEAKQRATWQCWSCHSFEYIDEIMPETHPHHARRNCARCGVMWRWLPKPENEKKPSRRGNGDVQLGRKFSRGYCEMCLQSESAFGSPDGHHVIEHQHGGTSDRDNVWVLCKRCHELVHWARRAYGRTQPEVAEETPANGELDL